MTITRGDLGEFFNMTKLSELEPGKESDIFCYGEKIGSCFVPDAISKLQRLNSPMDAMVHNFCSLSEDCLDLFMESLKSHAIFYLSINIEPNDPRIIHLIIKYYKFKITFDEPLSMSIDEFINWFDLDEFKLLAKIVQKNDRMDWLLRYGIINFLREKTRKDIRDTDDPVHVNQFITEILSGK
jgi:hypothetical protein